MNRDKGYYRRQRIRSIHRRVSLAKSIQGECIVCGKPLLECMLRDKKEGLLHKGNSGYLTDGRKVKTNRRKGHSAYRHKGAYGVGMYYSRHDRTQLDNMDYQMKEYVS